MAAPRKPSSPTPDWRARARPSDAPRRQKHVLRVLLTAGFLGLAGLFAWLVWLWLRSPPGVQLAVLPVTGYRIALAPVPFSSDDVAEFRASSPGQRPEVLDLLERSETLKGLDSAFQRLSPKEVLILYVSAHGVSEGGKPYLLCSDYFFGEAPGGESDPAAKGRLSLETVLEQVRKCRARLKLVLLDCNHIASDPRLGMAVNEFPRLLKGAVKQIDDPALWVLSCSRPLEVSRVLYAQKQKRSLFSHFVTEGFRGGFQGSVDTDGNGTVDLAEFYRFVRDGVAGYVEQHGSRGETQSPMLFHGGEGMVAKPPEEFLFRVRSAEEEQAPQPAKQEVASAEKAAPSAAAEKPAAPGAGETPAPQGGFPKARILSLLAKAWEWRDEEQRRKGPDNWSPVDYAPPLWREYQALLLGHEMRYRLGAAWPERSLAELEALGAKGPAEADQSIRGHLKEAKTRFASEGAASRFKGPAEDLRTVEEALKLKNELLFAAPYYVAWCARSAIVSPDSPTPLDDVEKLVGKLPKFIDKLETFEEGNRPESGSTGILESLKELSKSKEELEKLRAKIEIEGDGLEQQAAKLLQEIGPKAAGSEPRGAVGKIECLLATPLLSAKLRMELLRALDRVSTLPGASPPAKDRPDPAADRERWVRLARQAELEVRLVQLADPKFAPSFDPKRFLGARSTQDEAARWEEYGKLGGELKRFYERLPGRIDRAVRSKDAAQVRLARRLLPLVDARDAIVDARRVPATLGAQLSPIVLPPIAIPEAEKPPLEVAVAKEAVELKRDGAYVEIPVQVSQGPGVRASLQVQYTATLLEIRDRQEKLLIQPDRNIPLEPEEKQTLVLKVRPRDVARWSPTSLTLQFQAGGKPLPPKKIQLTLAAENVVTLEVKRIVNEPVEPVAQPGSGEGGQTGLIRCDAFPNRTTAYLFALKNLSGRKRDVTVEFWPAPERSRADQLAGRIPSDFEPPPGAKPLTTKPIRMTFPKPEDQTSKPIQEEEAAEKPEKPEKKETAEGAKPSAEKAKEASEKPEPGKEPKAAGIEVTHGIVCIIRDRAAKTKWTRWIDFRQVKPREYLEPRVSYVDGKIRVSLELDKNVQYLPLMTAEQPPIRVHWETAETAEGEVSVGPTRQPLPLTRPGLKDEVQTNVAPRKELPVWLTVDGYPRAFMYDCDPAQLSAKLDRDRRNVRIVAPKDGSALPPDAPLWVEFQADAPDDAFRPDEWVEVGLELKGDPTLAQRTRKSFAGDRQWVLRWEGSGPEGMVKEGTVNIRSEVGDFCVRLDTAPFSGTKSETKVDVRARLILRHPVTPKDVRDRRVSVVLDGAPPTVLRFDAQSPVVQGEDVPVSLEVSDLGGIGQVIFGFVKDKNALLDKDKNVILTEIPPARLAGMNELSFPKFLVPTKKAEADLRPDEPYYLAVRVWDKVGVESQKVGHDTQKVVLITIKKKEEVPPPVTTGTIEGRVYYRTQIVNDSKLVVRIEKLDGREEEVKADGTFVFRDVPPGTYTIEIKTPGTALGTFVKSGTTTVTVRAGKTETPKLPIELLY